MPEVLGQAPSVKILATSRLALNLRGEWLYGLEGLDFPKNGAVGNIERLKTESGGLSSADEKVAATLLSRHGVLLITLGEFDRVQKHRLLSRRRQLFERPGQDRLGPE